jgi:PilX N-terminal
MIAEVATSDCEALRGERGIALILALMALLLLTAIGLTLAVQSSVEVQSAVNYRWSRKALHNAEAGIAVGQSVLGELSWTYALPQARQPWHEVGERPRPRVAGLSDTADSGEEPSRDYELGVCDQAGNGMGYGVVLFDGERAYQNVSEIYGQVLDGSFTLWVRRPLVFDADGARRDYPRDDVLILVSEGRAPTASPGLPATQARQIVEVTLYASPMGVTIGPPSFVYSQAVVAATTTPFKVGSSVCR